MVDEGKLNARDMPILKHFDQLAAGELLVAVESGYANDAVMRQCRSN
ncbi:Uncharacterised protein [Vibrio cholerae]|nr:Uncharacterised protein [Vibrio cholerae]